MKTNATELLTCAIRPTTNLSSPLGESLGKFAKSSHYGQLLPEYVTEGNDTIWLGYRENFLIAIWPALLYMNLY